MLLTCVQNNHSTIHIDLTTETKITYVVILWGSKFDNFIGKTTYFTLHKNQRNGYCFVKLWIPWPFVLRIGELRQKKIWS
jgi:hypothetical protein